MRNLILYQEGMLNIFLKYAFEYAWDVFLKK